MNENEFTDEAYWTIIFLALYEETKTKHNNTWTSFVSDIMFGHRFFPLENRAISEIKNKAELSTLYYETGKTLYRARIFNDDPYAKITDLYRKELSLSKEQWEKDKSKYIHNPNLFRTQLSLLQDDVKECIENSSLLTPLKSALKKWQKLKFKGYDKQNSLPPPPEFAIAGRANPKGISYTYLCEDELTPIYEVRPTINQIVSIAKFKTTKKLKIYDLSAYKTDENEILPLFETISKKFSLPYNGKPEEYIPTQYITELIRTMGFDGIKFNSSLKENGKNVVLFNNDYKVLSSKLVQLKNYSLSIEPEVLSFKYNI